MSSTGFSPEHPDQHTARLIAQELKQFRQIDPDVDWSKAPGQVIVDCIHWLASRRETDHTKRDPSGVRFIHLTQPQSDMLWLCWYEASSDDITATQDQST